MVAINPGLVLSPVLDKDSSASVQLVAKLLKGEIPGLPRLGYPIVDVRDLADLEVRAMTAPQAAGQRYIGSGPFIPLSEIANLLKKHLGNAKAEKDLGWSSRPWEDTIVDTATSLEAMGALS